MRRALSATLFLLLAPVSACRPPGEAPDPAAGDPAGAVGTALPAEGPAVFFFSSGGEHHIQGFGAWEVELRRDGGLLVVHRVQGAVTREHSTHLDAAEAAALWSRIDALDLASVVIPGRPGVPDEVTMTFRLGPERSPAAELSSWAMDAAKHEGLAGLLGALRALIEKETGEKPVF